MARIRTIKPEVMDDEKSAGLSSDAWRLWVCMWTLADDEGRLRAHPLQLHARVFWACPHKVDIDEVLRELVRRECIIRYEVKGQPYAQIINFTKNQRIDHPTASKLPSINDIPIDDGVSREVSRGLAKNSSGSGSEGIGSEGIGSDGRGRPQCDPQKFQEAWTKHTRVTAPPSLLDCRLLCESAAAALVPPGDPNEYADRAIAKYIEWAASCTPGRRPQLAPHKFVEHFARIERLLAGLEEVPKETSGKHENGERKYSNVQAPVARRSAVPTMRKV